MDFYRIRTRAKKNGVTEVYPDFQIGRSRDIMTRGQAFYAVWDEDKQVWTTDEYELARLVDKELFEFADGVAKNVDGRVDVLAMTDFSSQTWMAYKSWLRNVADNSHELDSELTFQNTPTRKERYSSKRLPYSLEEGDHSAWDELVGTLYEPEERQKLEWAIGSIVAGDSRFIQKFVVLYGEAGAGKSTIINIMQDLFKGYYTTFDAKALASSNNAFATEVFKSNPLLAIQHDGDLSRIEDNAKLNSIVSHEEMTMNEKYKPSYMARVNAFLVMATNRPVKITDAKSGIIRRLIDVTPSGDKLEPKHYQAVMDDIKQTPGAIAQHCLDVYRSLGKNYYADYRPLHMQLQTDVFFNYVENYYEEFRAADSVTLKQAYDMYKQYCEEALLEYRMPLYKFREELKGYFKTYEDRSRDKTGARVRSYYKGFLADKFQLQKAVADPEKPYVLTLDTDESLIDDLYKDCPAQMASPRETPKYRWANVKTTLKDVDTSQTHYVKPPAGHIVIDFDLRGDDGEKSTEKNLEAASQWPPTYAEFSKGGHGIHLHYIYDGDPTQLKTEYSAGIEVKTFTGDASLRRRVSLCNNIPPAHISDGLPLKEQKPMLNSARIQTEKSLRDLIGRNLRKEIHPGTKPSVDFIHKILEDAYTDGLEYDVTDMRPTIMRFASQSTNQATTCLKLVSDMKFKSEDKDPEISQGGFPTGELVFFDVEVFPNLFVICWIPETGEKVRAMVNPTPEEVEALCEMNLVGFNNRKYDNHMLYGRHLGYDNAQMFELSKRVIENTMNGGFADAYNISYADIYDFASKKQSLKKWEIELGLKHKELDLPWDQPVPTDMVEKVVEYCKNDVLATRDVFNNRNADFQARKALAHLSGLDINASTNAHTKRIIFGRENKPQGQFVYTDLSETFPGYKFEAGKSTYRGETTGEGGYVYAEPGIHHNVALLDVASMHPASIEALNLFGPYTEKFSNIKKARLLIKHGQIEEAEEILGITIDEGTDLEGLSFALKIAINSVYGLTAARFENAFRDPRNVDNIVAKRGALFMIDLKHAVQEKGYTVAHIKTDSIKIPDADQEIIDFVFEFGRKYGYEFEHEATYEKMCLVNDAVYVAKKDGKWSATGAQFQHPYVFKRMFSGEEITIEDYYEVRSVTTSMYLDFNESLPEDQHSYHFIGKVGKFIPVVEGSGGGIILRKKDDQYHSVGGTKGHRWIESWMMETSPKEIDTSYAENLVIAARETIGKFGDVEAFLG